MFGTRSYEYHRPHATFLLPSLPKLFRSRKPSQPVVPSPNASSFRHESVDTSSSTTSSDDASRQSPPSYRDSVASASSVMSASTTATSQFPPSLCTSPSSCGSTSLSPGSSPPAAGVHDFHPDGSQPSFAHALTAEPELEDNITLSGRRRRDSGEIRRRSSGMWSLPWQWPALSPPPPATKLARVAPDTLRCRRCAADLAYAAQIVSKGFTGRHGRAYLVSAPATSPNAAHLFAPEVPHTAFGDDGEMDFDLDLYHDDEESLSAGNLVNVRVGRPEHRQLVTGPHVVADISCAQCHAKLGWKYVDARDASQRYKVGKYILEIARLATFHSWEDVEDNHHEDGYPEYDHGELGGGLDAVANPVAVARHRMVGLLSPSPTVAHTSKDAASAVEFDSSDEDECEEIFAGTWNAATVAERRREKRNRAAAAAAAALLDV